MTTHCQGLGEGTPCGGLRLEYYASAIVCGGHQNSILVPGAAQTNAGWPTPIVCYHRARVAPDSARLGWRPPPPVGHPTVTRENGPTHGIMWIHCATNKRTCAMQPYGHTTNQHVTNCIVWSPNVPSACGTVSSTARYAHLCDTLWGRLHVWGEGCCGGAFRNPGALFFLGGGGGTTIFHGGCSPLLAWQSGRSRTLCVGGGGGGMTIFLLQGASLCWDPGEN